MENGCTFVEQINMSIMQSILYHHTVGSHQSLSPTERDHGYYFFKAVSVIIYNKTQKNTVRVQRKSFLQLAIRAS